MSTYWSTESPMEIIKESYRPPYAKPRSISIPILASTSSAFPAAEITQTMGRGAKRVSFTAHVSTWNYYELLLTDALNAEVRHFIGPDNTTELTFRIENLGEPQWLLPDDIRFTITLVEAAT